MLSLVCALAVSASVAHTPQEQQTPVPIHVLKIAAGPAGSETKGTFDLTEERSTFNRSDDREVIVLFHWEGSPGAHKLAAQWRSPDGSLTSRSVVDYMAKDRRFGAYWSLPLSSGIQLGNWSIEATVDGQPAGRFNFEITDTKIAPATIKRPLVQSDLYERLTKMFVVLQRFSADGRELDGAAGFVGPGGRLFTAMAAVDDTDRIRALMADGSSRDVTALIAWSRRQDWAIMAIDPASEQPFTVAPADATKVGDRCFTMEGGSTGGRVLLEGTISGKGGSGPGPSLLATFFTGAGTPGAPVLSEFGELIGIVGGGNVPGATRLMHIMRFRALLRGVPIVPFAVVQPAESAMPQPMAELRSRGQLISALSGDEHVVSGGFARDISKGHIAPSEQREEFSAQEKGFVVFITWSPRQRLRGVMRLRLYDAENRVLVESKPTKSDLRKERLTLSSWDIPMLRAPATYRADVLFDDKPVWRGFVRITN